MGILDWLFGRRRDGETPDGLDGIHNPEITIATPIAAAGADVSGRTRKSESEKALDDAVLRDRARW